MGLVLGLRRGFACFGLGRFGGLCLGLLVADTREREGLEVTFDKTTHLIFPAPIRYVDLGSQNIIAGKAEDAENVLRIKACRARF